MAIRSFSDHSTEIFFQTGIVPKGVGWVLVKSVVRRKLDMIDYAHDLEDLKAPPGNRLEALLGNLSGPRWVQQKLKYATITKEIFK